MSLNIKNEATHALVRELAALRGVSQTDAVDEAVRARLAELNAQKEQQRRFDRTMEIARETSQLIRETGGPLSLEDRSDELGLPT